MRKIVIYRWSAPTRRQLEYLVVLARRTRREIPRPRTRGEASAWIDALKKGCPIALPSERRSLIGALRALLRRLYGLPRESGAGTTR